MRKRKSKLSGHFVYFFQPFGAVKQAPNRSFVCQHSTHDSEDIDRGPVQLAVVLDDGDKAVCGDRNINLYSQGVFGCPPEIRHPKMLLDTPKEESHLPALLVQQGDVLCLECEVVSQEHERLHVLVALVLVYDAIKGSLRHNNDELTEYVLFADHVRKNIFRQQNSVINSNRHAPFCS